MAGHSMKLQLNGFSRYDDCLREAGLIEITRYTSRIDTAFRILSSNALSYHQTRKRPPASSPKLACPDLDFFIVLEALVNVNDGTIKPSFLAKR